LAAKSEGVGLIDCAISFKDSWAPTRGAQLSAGYTVNTHKMVARYALSAEYFDITGAPYHVSPNCRDVNRLSQCDHPVAAAENQRVEKPVIELFIE